MDSQDSHGTSRFVEQFADHWAAGGGSRIEGKIAGFLLLDESDGVSAASLSHELGVSTGSVSTYTRQLIARGFVHRIRKPGQRTHFFVMDDDVWAGFLKSEQEYLGSQRDLAAETLPLLNSSGRAWHRVRNMRDYMDWMVSSRLPRAWDDFKSHRDSDA